MLYTGWEYVDKGQIGIKCLWATRPDGDGRYTILLGEDETLFHVDFANCQNDVPLAHDDGHDVDEDQALEVAAPGVLNNDTDLDLDELTASVGGPDGRWLPRTPAMAAGLANHVWSLWEWLTFPVVQRE